MKNLLPYLVPFIILSCSNAKPSDKTKNAEKKGTLRYLEDDLPFIAKADSICRGIDAENTFERTKDSTVTDRDGQIYPSHYEGYAKTPSDSIAKFKVTINFGGKKSASSTFYYYNGDVLKAFDEIFADDTVKVALYYDGAKAIYPQEAGQEEQWPEVAEKLQKQARSFKMFFLPKK